MLFYPGNKSKGFSLLEVLASILLLAGLISIFVQLSYGNTRRVRKARQLEKAASLLEKKMMELEEEFKGSKVPPEEDKGEFEGEKGYSWSYQAKPLALPPMDILSSLFHIPDNEMNRKMIDIVSGVLSSTVVELKLRVHYEGKRGQTFSYSLVSYFVTYLDAEDFIFKYLSDMLPQGQFL